MNSFIAFTTLPSPRLARLVVDGETLLSNRLGRALTPDERADVQRKASVVETYERLANERANETKRNERITNGNVRECTGIFCPLPQDKINNARFVMPADGWIHVAPLGNHSHPRGLIQVIDKTAVDSMVKNFQEQKKDPKNPGPLVDLDHLSQLDGKGTAAAGWVTNLQSRDDGLWAQVAWSDEGKKAVEGGLYRATSPVWERAQCVPVDGMPENYCRPMVLDSIGLTNLPNLDNLTPISKIV